MILAQHSFRHYGRCPIDGSHDSYDVTVTVNDLISVERILKIATKITRFPIFQEKFTEQLGVEVGALRVTTVCDHSSVTTTCTWEP